MLDALRNSSKSWLAKALLGLLVLSFAVWGISGTMFQGAGDTVVAVGDTRVTPIEYRLAYDRQLAIVSRSLGTRLTTEQARAFGLENQVLGQVVSNAALDEQSRRMNLGLSRDRLASIIAEDPAFQGINGRFDRNVFSSLLRNVGMTEEEYIVSQENAAVRTQIVEAVADGYRAPQTLVSALNAFDNETRTIDYVVLNPDIAGTIADPTESELQSFFDDNRLRYRAPEFRSVAYVTLLADDIADPEAIADDAVRADYEQRIDRYTTPERRTIEQINFSDGEAARAAAEQIAGGAAFEDIVAAQGRSLSDIRLGTFERTRVPDPAIADAAFAIAAEGGTSGVVDGTFGPVMLRVPEIIPQSVRGFEEVADEIRGELAIVEADAILLDVHDAYEDARAGGDSLEEAARRQRLSPVTIDAVDRTGRDPDGNVLGDLPESQALLAAVFDTEISVDSPPINIGADGFLWFEVLDIVPERERTLDEVRERVVADWKAEQTDEALSLVASQLRERIENGEELASIATEIGVVTDTKYDLRRSYQDVVFGAAAVSAAFAGPQGLVAVADDAGDSAKILMTVTEVSTPAAVSSAGDNQALDSAVSSRMGDDMLNQMISVMQTEFGVSYNPRAAELALSATQH